MEGSTRRRFLAGGGASAAALALGAPGLLGCNEEDPEPARRGERRPPDAPNVVLIIVDTLRADHVFGPRARTPNIDALAGMGIAFTRCFPEAMPTVPARRSILSGRRVFPFRNWHPYPKLLPEPGWAPLSSPALAFTSVLRKAGYWTAYATDNTPLGFSPSWAPFRASFDRFARRGGQYGGTDKGVSDAELRHWLPPVLEDPATRDRIRRYLANGQYSHDETKSFAARVFKDGSELLRIASERRRRGPFALVVDTFEPHEPWTPPRRYLDMYGDPDYHGPEPARPYYAPVSRYLSGADLVLVDRMKALYAAEVTMTDRWLGVFMDRLHELGLEDDTIIVLAADHGFLVGEHGLTGKHWNRLYPELIHVPLIVIDPARRKAGVRSEYYAQTHDVAPTILSMAGVPAPRGMDGVNLSRLFEDRRLPERPFAWGGYGNAWYVRTDDWKAFGTNIGEDIHLFDVERDRRETRDLAAARAGKARELYRTARRKAGGPLPYYPETV